SYSIANPIHEATDELRHYRFVRYIAVNKSLPVQGEEPCRSQSHHPPLIYALGALATFWIDGAHDICYTPPENPFWNYRYWEVGVDNKSQYLHGADEAFPWWGDALIAHIVRLINVLVGAGAVWLTWGTGRLLFPRRPILPLVAAAIVGFNPQFVYLAAAINNDVIAALSGTAILFATVKLLTSESRLSWRWGVTFGLLFGLALMSKFNLAAFALPIATATTWLAWRRNQWRGWLELVALAAVLT
ncbi:MAG: glycosyltransferase family 39 protein, partial [Anaerolineales bacterium]|nr:glycosyltransferase family 39 protein [Anaerolineales bacterium]